MPVAQSPPPPNLVIVTNKIVPPSISRTPPGKNCYPELEINASIMNYTSAKTVA